ncbi:hypothetical protein ACFSX9_15785 [Flavobacterium ardleyense]|uniref:Uncharacterized protein n=1 Tax=Flavobacterium ardleyense TaxID=2038737 RepID=A0ABW5ZDM4_9FLAO
MEITIDLQRILWHELGHFCIDLIDTKRDENFSIDAFWVSYHKVAISDHKWGGGVKVIPSIKYEVLVEDIDKTSFSILNVISGCIFQTVFIKEIIKNEISTKDCFCPQGRCAGQQDFFTFHGITSKIRNRYGLSRELIYFSEIELFDIYYNLIIENKLFIENISELITYYANKIFKKYEQSDNKDEFFYYFNFDEIQLLRKEVYDILVITSFENTIEILKEKIKDKIIA